MSCPPKGHTSREDYLILKTLCSTTIPPVPEALRISHHPKENQRIEFEELQKQLFVMLKKSFANYERPCDWNQWNQDWQLY